METDITMADTAAVTRKACSPSAPATGYAPFALEPSQSRDVPTLARDGGASSRIRHEIFNDHFQNYKRHAIPKAQLVIADIPYNVGKNAYGSNPAWYINGDNSNGESKLANSEFFDTDKDFRVSEFLHFCSKMLIKEPKETGKAPCMVVFCAFDQQWELIEKAKEHGMTRYINLVFTKNFSAQVLKANMRIVGNCEYAILLYRDKLPKFNNAGKMVFNAMEWPRDSESEKIHPTQKPVRLLQRLINLFTDPGDVVIDPVCGSGSTVIAASRCGRSAFGFEIKKNFHKSARGWLEREKRQTTLNFAVRRVEVEAAQAGASAHERTIKERNGTQEHN